MKLNELQAFQGSERSAMRQWLVSSGMEQTQIELLFRLFNKKGQGQGATAQELSALEPVEQLLHNLAAQGIAGLKRTDQIAKAGQKKRDQKGNVTKDKDEIKTSSSSVDGVDIKLAASKQYEDIDESMAYAMPGQDEENETVTYSKTKKQGDATVTVSANADSMDELHQILKLAGITLPNSDKEDNDHEGHDDMEKDHVEDGETCDCCGNEVVDGDCGCGSECPHCGGEPGDTEEPKAIVVKGLPQDDEKPNYSTDKEVLINYLKDKISKSV